MADLGVLGPVVKATFSIAAAAAAIRTAALGKGLWEPPVTSLPRLPFRIAGVMSGVFVAVNYAAASRYSDFAIWLKLCTGLTVGLVITFLLDLFLRSAVIVQCTPRSKAFIGGLWLQPTARAIVRGHPTAYEVGHLSLGQAPPASGQVLFCSFSADTSGLERLDRVWSPRSRATATALIVTAYMFWNMLAVAAFATAGTLISM